MSAAPPADVPPADDLRPQTRLARLTRWVPTPGRTWRAAKRRPGAALFTAAVAAGLFLPCWPHLRAAGVGHLLRYEGHRVTFDHYLDERLRTWAPLPTDSFLWKTPVEVDFVGAGEVWQPPAHIPARRLGALPHVRRVSYSVMTVDAAAARRLAAVHRDDWLTLWECDLLPGSVAPLAAAPGVSILGFNNCDLPPGELGAFAGRPSLKHLWLNGATGVRGELVPLKGHPALMRVHAEGTDFGDDDLAALAACPALRTLNLNRTDVTDAGLAALAGRAPLLWRLDLANARVGDAGVAALGDRPALTDLDLSNTALTDAALPGLARSCPNLTTCDLSGTAVTDAGLEALRGLGKLRALGVRDTAVTAAAAGTFAEDSAADGRAVEVRR